MPAALLCEMGDVAAELDRFVGPSLVLGVRGRVSASSEATLKLLSLELLLCR